MRNAVRFFLVLACAALLAGGVTYVPEALAGMETFRVERVEVEGLRYLSEADVHERIDLSPVASVWDAPDAWEARLEGHPLVRGAEIIRRLPSTLVIRVEERRPVGLVATPTLEPVDAEGRVLPVDPSTHRLDLPLLRAPVTASGTDPVSPALRRDSPGPRHLRVLAGEAARLERLDPGFLAAVSELALLEGEEIVALWGEALVPVHFHAPLSAHRVAEAKAVLADAEARWPGRRVASVDLRYEDQVVLRFSGGTGRAVTP